jgi:hypothetical protein
MDESCCDRCQQNMNGYRCFVALSLPHQVSSLSAATALGSGAHEAQGVAEGVKSRRMVAVWKLALAANPSRGGSDDMGSAYRRLRHERSPLGRRPAGVMMIVSSQGRRGIVSNNIQTIVAEEQCGGAVAGGSIAALSSSTHVCALAPMVACNTARANASSGATVRARASPISSDGGAATAGTGLSPRRFIVVYGHFRVGSPKCKSISHLVP